MIDTLEDLDRHQQDRDEWLAYTARVAEYRALKDWWGAQRTLRAARTAAQRKRAIKAIGMLKLVHGEALARGLHKWHEVQLRKQEYFKAAAVHPHLTELEFARLYRKGQI